MSEPESQSPSVSSANRIYYCEQCGLRIPPADFIAHKAGFRSESEAVCGKCNSAKPAAANASASRPPSGSNSMLKPASGIHAVHAASAHNTHAKPAKRAAKSKQSSPLIAAAAGAAFVGILLIGFVMTRKNSDPVAQAKPEPVAAPAQKLELKKDPQPAPVTVQIQKPVAPTPAQPARIVESQPTRPIAPVTAPQDDYDPRKAVADSLLAQAKTFQKTNPDDPFGYRDKLQFLIERYRSTAAGEEAAKLITEIKLPEFNPDLHPEPTPDTAWANATKLITETIRTDRGMWWKRPLPYVLPEEYDLRFTFNRLDSDDCIVLVLSRHGKPFLFSMGSGNSWLGFEDIKTSRKDLVPTGIRRSGLISNNTVYQAVVQVRKSCLRGYINGKLTIGCQVEDEGLSVKPELVPPTPGQPSIWTWNSVFEISSLEVLPIKGELRPLK